MGGSNSKQPYCEPVTEPTETESAIYRSVLSKDALIQCPMSGERTVQEVYLKNFQKKAGQEFLGRKVNKPGEKGTFEWMTWKEIEGKVRALGAAFEKLGLAPEKAQYKDYKLKFIGIQGRNSVEWILTDITNICFGYVTMPLYDTLGDEAVEHMFKETELETLFLTTDLIEGIVKKYEDGNCPTLKNLVIMNDKNLTEDLKKSIGKLKWYAFSELLEKYKDEKVEYPTVNPDDIVYFSYTSGTTGNPKGCMISNRNCMSAIGGAEKMLYYIKPDSVYLSYLPLAHVFEKVVFMYLSYLGARYGIFGGDIRNLKDDLATLRPTFFCSVPKLLNRFHEGILEEFDKKGGISGLVARRALYVKSCAVENYGTLNDKVYDYLVFSKVKKLLGGRCEFIMSASAPLSVTVKKDLKAAFCCPIMEGYGQTEGMGGQFVQDINDTELDTVGGPVPMNEFKLVDLPDMKYTHLDKDEDGNLAPRGEVYVRGPNIIPGYYKNDEKNKDTFTEDGWLISGDIGMIVPGSHALKIVDRKKNILKLSQGEYVAPEKLEHVYKATPGVSEIFVHGDSLKSVLVAVVVLDKDDAPAEAKKAGVDSDSLEEICKSEEMAEHIKKKLREVADSKGLKGFERIDAVYLEHKSFVDNGLATSTFKLQREQVKEHYKEQLEKLYEGKK